MWEVYNKIILEEMTERLSFSKLFKNISNNSLIMSLTTFGIPNLKLKLLCFAIFAIWKNNVNFFFNFTRI